VNVEDIVKPERELPATVVVVVGIPVVQMLANGVNHNPLERVKVK
jgi:hypothetical protein